MGSDRLRAIALAMSTGPGKRHVRAIAQDEVAGMLLSFERPARSPALAGASVLGCGARARLFSDLENCTVANDTGITGRGRKASPEITVKIVRACGGCLGTKSR
jgi:hypothetical protein